MSNKKSPQPPWKELRYVQKKYDIQLGGANASSLLVPCPCYPLPWGQHSVPASPEPAGTAYWNSLAETSTGMTCPFLEQQKTPGKVQTV